MTVRKKKREIERERVDCVEGRLCKGKERGKFRFRTLV
jgi:hypothetical protein